jgi:hypothetical protein
MAVLLTLFFGVPAVYAYFGLLLGLGQFFPPERLRLICRALWPLRLNLWHMMCAVAVAAFLMLGFQNHFVTEYEVVLGLVATSLVVTAWFVRVWNQEFVFLMGLRDDDLPGRNDKFIWAFLLFAFAPIAVWFFRSYRLAHWPEPVVEARSLLDPEPVGMKVTQPT